MDAVLRTYYLMRDFSDARGGVNFPESQRNSSGTLSDMKGNVCRQLSLIAKATQWVPKVHLFSPRWEHSASSVALEVVLESQSPDARQFRRHDRVHPRLRAPRCHGVPPFVVESRHEASHLVTRIGVSEMHTAALIRWPRGAARTPLSECELILCPRHC